VGCHALDPTRSIFASTFSCGITARRNRNRTFQPTGKVIFAGVCRMSKHHSPSRQSSANSPTCRIGMGPKKLVILRLRGSLRRRPGVPAHPRTLPKPRAFHGKRALPVKAALTHPSRVRIYTTRQSQCEIVESHGAITSVRVRCSNRIPRICGVNAALATMKLRRPRLRSLPGLQFGWI